jgi:Kef-type K+ transport system membrane component KefB
VAEPDTIARIVFEIVAAFACARLLARLVALAGAPSVVGELLAGALLAAFGVIDIHENDVMDALAALGVILLLFTAGLGTHVRELAKVKGVAIAVGIAGAALPFVAGVIVAIPFGYPMAERLFVATALMATSVGITVRVLQELGYEKRKSARIILAAAVIDDVFGLFVLTLVIGYSGGRADPVELALLTAEAGAFLAFFLFLGPRVVNRLSSTIARVSEGLFFEIAVIVMLAMALLAQYLELAAIVGAFLAGVVLAEARQHHSLEERFEPLAWFLTPFFFVSVGAYVSFGSLTRPAVLAATVVFTLVAVVTKYAGAVLAAWPQGARIANEVGVGMIPRGEVGIVVASTALTAGVVDDDVYTAVIAMVVLTSFIAPFLIARVYGRSGDRRGSDGGGVTRSRRRYPLTY